ncbi:copper chaperone PCu(A)C [Micromonospora antibiotica]|uniref:Copper chaperone PCu(A)C n=1 Tax=Micromonospora antibiotica TaxID=2807623 RepID=A0ABS3V6P1_9ACTN|nr:copper chaperone PCu(A)C [Micromonospora antibiotica]MBO4161291.1 copper chaperone PCu(A)C [Micromonospora antibiotica]
MRTTSPFGSRRRSAVVLATAAVLVAVGAGGCASSDSSSTAQPSPSASASAAAGVVTIRDPWVKAADKGMTAAFGTLVNDGDTDVTLTSAATSVSPMELHEMTMKDGKMVMQQKQGGIVIKAKSTHALEPGGDHLMLMDLTKPVQAGDELTFTLTFADGKTQQFTAVAKPFTGAQETYAPGHGEPMPGMSATPGMTMTPAS